MGVIDRSCSPIRPRNYPKKSSKMAPKKAGMKKKKARSTSNVFSQFEQAQIQEFKEAFQMIDVDRNGVIDVGDLKATYASLGVRNMEMEVLEGMVSEAGAPINFTIFLNMLADKLHGTDPEDQIVAAFKIFDKQNTGVVSAGYLKEVLMTQADRMDEKEIETLMEIAPTNDNGDVDYKNFCYMLTHGSAEDE